MLRKLALVGGVAVLASAFPAWFEKNPDALDGLFRPDEPREAEAPSLVAQPYPVAVARAPEAPIGREARIERDARGHYSTSFRLNGRDVDGVIDTGATAVAINLSTARRIGLELLPDDFRYEVETANGRTRAAFARLASLQVGRVHVEDVETLVLDDRALGAALIGMSFLNRLRTYRVEGGALILEQ